MRKCDPVHNGGNRIALADVFFQKLHSGRGIVEKIPDNERCSLGTACVVEQRFLAALDAVTCSDLFALTARHDLNSGNCGNRGKSLSTETEGAYRIQIVRRRDLAGGVADKSLSDIIPVNSASVVRDAYIGDTASFYFKRDLIRSCVDRIFHYFLDNGGRSFDHLACGDKLRNVLG